MVWDCDWFQFSSIILVDKCLKSEGYGIIWVEDVEEPTASGKLLREKKKTKFLGSSSQRESRMTKITLKSEPRDSIPLTATKHPMGDPRA